MPFQVEIACTKSTNTTLFLQRTENKLPTKYICCDVTIQDWKCVAMSKVFGFFYLLLQV